MRVRKDGKRVPTTVRMQARDETSGLASSSLKAICAGTTRAAGYRPADTAGLEVHLDRIGCTLRGRADDRVGHSTARTLKPGVGLFDVRRGSSHLKLSPGWKTLKQNDSLGRSLARSSSKDATITLRFKGAQFAVVARRGPGGGRIKIIVDGKLVETVDLYATKADSRRIVSVRNVTQGEHVVKLRNAGTSRAKSSGATVWIDAILVLDRRR